MDTEIKATNPKITHELIESSFCWIEVFLIDVLSVASSGSTDAISL
ncbi:MAG: hypothetical protein GY744_16535 [Gammaproteobacteria bacterium]|nr:hypothetical protein [Gammaproteobacteria bacterium]